MHFLFVRSSAVQELSVMAAMGPLLRLSIEAIGQLGLHAMFIAPGMKQHGNKQSPVQQEEGSTSIAVLSGPFSFHPRIIAYGAVCESRGHIANNARDTAQVTSRGTNAVAMWAETGRHCAPARGQSRTTLLTRPNHIAHLRSASLQCPS